MLGKRKKKIIPSFCSSYTLYLFLVKRYEPENIAEMMEPTSHGEWTQSPGHGNAVLGLIEKLIQRDEHEKCGHVFEGWIHHKETHEARDKKR